MIPILLLFPMHHVRNLEPSQGSVLPFHDSAISRGLSPPWAPIPHSCIGWVLRACMWETGGSQDRVGQGRVLSCGHLWATDAKTGLGSTSFCEHTPNFMSLEVLPWVGVPENDELVGHMPTEYLTRVLHFEITMFTGNSSLEHSSSNSSSSPSSFPASI